MGEMNTLAMVTDQLKAVALHADWGNHDKHMEDVNAELAEINQQIEMVIFLRDAVGKIDDHVYRKIASGEAAPMTQVIELFVESNSLLDQVCRRILPTADEFAQKGFRVERLSRFRAIASNPSAGLSMLQIAMSANQSTVPDGTPAEATFDLNLLRKASAKGKAFRHLGND